MNLVQTNLRNKILMTLSIVFLCGMASCMGKKVAHLEPPYSDASEELTVTTQVKGVRMEVSPEWPGTDSVTVKATLLQVTIENNSPDPLILRYEYFVLAGGRGEQFAALPPFNFQQTDIAGAPPRPAQQYSPVADIRLEQTNFYVAPYYAALYPQLRAAQDVFFFNDAYYKAYGDFLKTADVPPDVYAWVIPEGMLQSGGKIRGVLLFEPVDPKLNSVIFRASLVNSSGRMFGFIAAPFIVRQEAKPRH